MLLAVLQMKYSDRGKDRRTICVIYALDLCIFLVKNDKTRRKVRKCFQSSQGV